MPKDTAKPTDPRWSLLDLVRISRDALGLRDRDITVLRGLLSLVPADAPADGLIVFASNRVLIERCDGIDERTLRRRIDHLRARGLLARRNSPNGKRFQLRDCDDLRLTYGIDLGPLFQLRDHLAALADQCQQDALRQKSLRAVIRDLIYHHGAQIDATLCDTARRALRRVLPCAALEQIITTIASALPKPAPLPVMEPAELTASNSQNDRHIQNSNKEDFESESTLAHVETAPPDPAPAEYAKMPKQQVATDITLGECLELAHSAADFAPARPQNWDDLIDLSATLAPAIGLQRPDLDAARQHLGAHGSALAILGLVQAYDRIRNPRAYLHRLIAKGRDGGVDFVRMFRSLARPQMRALV